MESNLAYRRAFLIIAYGILVQFFILPFFEVPMLPANKLKAYIVTKFFTFLIILGFVFCVHTLRLVKHWVWIFYTCCFSFVLLGEFFNPGYHYAVIQFMFVCGIIFKGIPFMSILLMILFMVEYTMLPFYKSTFPAYPFYHSDVFNALISSFFISMLLEIYVNRVKNKHSVLDKKLRYKGIKTELFMHELKNKLQPMVYLYSDQEHLKDLLKTVHGFNSFHEDDDLRFKDVVEATRAKFKIIGDCTVTGIDDFFIDQMDLQTILCNLMTNSLKASQARGISLHILLKNNQSGFSYEDNAGGMTDEQYKFFNQKNFKPYPGHEKNGLGILLTKKLVEHHDGKFTIKKIPDGTRFEINY